MGKKSRRPGASNASPSGNILLNKTVCRLVDDLWAGTQALENNSVPNLWKELDAVRSYTTGIAEKQGSSSPLPDRRAALPAFEKWLTDNGAKYDAVDVVEFPEVGFALRAKRAIKQDEKVIVVPRKLMMTSLTARQGPLGPLIARDQMLQMMPNVALAVHLLNERYDPNSFWKPYIDILPHTFTTPFYFSKEDLQMLQSSPCLTKAILQIRNASKLYAHLHRVIRTTCDPSLHLYNAGFYFKDFLWAVSAVMSRQNEIPQKTDGKGNVLALIPLWDFCNHAEGHMTTFYNLEEQSCDCYAQEDTPMGAEFRIFYGPRPNHDLLVHQGFVYMENKSDALQIRLGLGVSDASYSLRKDLLDKLCIPVSGHFSIYRTDCPFSPHLVAFTRVFTATVEDLQPLVEMDSKEMAETILRGRWSGDQRVLDFLEKRCSLLLRSYQTSIEEDTALLGRLDTFSPYAREAIKMRLCEKRILQAAITYAQTVQKQLEIIKTLQEHGGITYDELRQRMEKEGRVLPATVPVGSEGLRDSGLVGGMLPSRVSKQESPLEVESAGSEAAGQQASADCVTSETCVQVTMPQQETSSQPIGERVTEKQEVIGDGGLGMEELVISDEGSVLTSNKD